MNVTALEFLPQVRQMCEENRCRSYGKCWTCPPGCGSLEDIALRARQYANGILVQSVGKLEDVFDIETMLETEAMHKARFLKLVEAVRMDGIDCLPMSAGACTICQSCSYPKEPCRFPDQAIPSMEAYGILVSNVCVQSGMKYNYGPCTVCYTSCILL